MTLAGVHPSAAPRQTFAATCRKSAAPGGGFGASGGTQESNLALRFWRPPCYRYTSPPAAPHSRSTAPARASSLQTAHSARASPAKASRASGRGAGSSRSGWRRVAGISAFIASRAEDGSGHPGGVEFAAALAWRGGIGAAGRAALCGRSRPFVLRDPDRFRGGAPHPRDSAAAADLNEVKAVGRATGSTRTPDQTAAAEYWGTTNSTATLASVIRSVAGGQGGSLADHARLFARVHERRGRADRDLARQGSVQLLAAVPCDSGGGERRKPRDCGRPGLDGADARTARHDRRARQRPGDSSAARSWTRCRTSTAVTKPATAATASGSVRKPVARCRPRRSCARWRRPLGPVAHTEVAHVERAVPLAQRVVSRSPSIARLPVHASERRRVRASDARHAHRGRPACTSGSWSVPDERTSRVRASRSTALRAARTRPRWRQPRTDRRAPAMDGSRGHLHDDDLRRAGPIPMASSRRPTARSQPRTTAQLRQASRTKTSPEVQKPAICRNFQRAGDPGIEPGVAVLETAVLPIHQSPSAPAV